MTETNSATATGQKAVGNNKELVERMFAVGAHFGYGYSRRHPSVKPFIFGRKQRVELFDLEKTSEEFEKAKAFAEALGAEGKTLLLVGGKPEAAKIVRDAATAAQLPFVAGRWIGGTFTNFAEIKKRIERLLMLISQREKGELAKYTKHERLLIDREIDKLETMFGGLRELHDRLPDAVFVIDTKREHIAVEEARQIGIPVIGLMNTDCNLSDATYPIPANDSSVKSILFFVHEIVTAYQRGVAAPKPSTPASSAAAAEKAEREEK